MAEPLVELTRLGVVNSVLAVEPFYRGRSKPAREVTDTRWVRYPAVPGNFGLASAGAFLFARILPTIRSMHQARPVDLIHAHGPLPCGHAAMLVSRDLGIPFVVTVHGLDAFSSNQVRGKAAEWCRRVSRTTFLSSRAVICVSEHVRERVLDGVKCETAVVYNGADPEVFHPADNLTEPVSPTVVSVGNLIAIKGHETLLRAVAAIGDKHSGVVCEIIGDGPEQGRLELLARELQLADRVMFRGRLSRNEVSTALRHATLFALPSRFEGLGCVYLEAMACGKVAIGCRGQGIEEIIQHGLNGWLVGSESVNELADALRTLLENSALRQAIAERARQTIVGSFTMRHQAERLLRVYRESLR